jgi:hypothetical protein
VLKFAIPAVLSATLLASTAVAAPLALPAAGSSDHGLLIQVKDWKHDKDWKYHDKNWKHKDDRWDHDEHHHKGHPPRGWHSYHQRPNDWHRRGCMAVGPLWYCP